MFIFHDRRHWEIEARRRTSQQDEAANEDSPARGASPSRVQVNETLTIITNLLESQKSRNFLQNGFDG